MVRDVSSERPFHRAPYELVVRGGDGGGGGRSTLTWLDPGEAKLLGAAFAVMNPWAAYRTPAPRLAGFFAAVEHDCARYAIRHEGRLSGVVVVRWPWLHGPYLQFLGLLEGQQGFGLGEAVLDWMAAEAPPGTRNLWLCVSAFNTRARIFYERNGYEMAATIPSLAADDIDEILMRRRLPGTAGSAGD